MLAEFAKLLPYLPYLPTSLILLRFCLAPVLLADASDGKTSSLFILAFIAAFLSDIFDGIIARRLGSSTAKLRQADSWADVVLYLCVSASALLVRPDAIALFGFNYTGFTLWLAILIGIFHTLEEIAMTLILPVWTHDVLSLKHALQWQNR